MYYIIRVYLTDGFADIKSHPEENIVATFTATTCDVIINNWKGRSFRFNCSNLNKEIVPSESYVRQGGSGLTLMLKKVKTETWDTLNKKESSIPNPMGDGMGGGKGEDPQGNMMEMMKNMYQNGDA